jgi:uncharacterized protein YdaU (DUF1376 family)
MTITTRDCAKQYAKDGWPVLQVYSPSGARCNCGNRDCQAIGKHPCAKNGLYAATTDESKIDRWFTERPDANIGVRTGRESGFLVLDLDNKGGKHGSDNLAALASSFGGIPPTLRSITGSGEHLFFRYPGTSIKSSQSRLAEGVDVRSDGAFVVVPPSIHANGQQYKWSTPELPMADLPTWVIEHLTQTGNVDTASRDQVALIPASMAIIPEGLRNSKLYKTGCALRGQSAMEYEEILTILLDYNLATCKPPLEPAEVVRVTQSVCEHPREGGSKKSGKRLEQNPLYWLPHYTRELFTDQDLMLMSDYQIGWHLLLLSVAWNAGGYLPADMDKLWRLARAKSKKAFERDCALVLAAYEEVMIDGIPRLRHKRLADLYVETLELWMKKKEAGLARARLVREEKQRW